MGDNDKTIEALIRLNDALLRCEGVICHACDEIEIVAPAEVPLPCGTKLVFKKTSGLTFHRSGSKPLPIQNASIQERIEAAHVLPKLLEVLREAQREHAERVEAAAKLASATADYWGRMRDEGWLL